MAVNPNPNYLLLVISLMKFLNNGMPFIHKTNLWVYIKHFIEKKLWAYLPNPNMECNVLKIIATKYFLLKPAGTQKLDIGIPIVHKYREGKMQRTLKRELST